MVLKLSDFVFLTGQDTECPADRYAPEGRNEGLCRRFRPQTTDHLVPGLRPGMRNRTLCVPSKKAIGFIFYMTSKRHSPQHCHSDRQRRNLLWQLPFTSIKHDQGAYSLIDFSTGSK